LTRRAGAWPLGLLGYLWAGEAPAIVRGKLLPSFLTAFAMKWREFFKEYQAYIRVDLIFYVAMITMLAVGVMVISCLDPR
jgi:hypothetical protein